MTSFHFLLLLFSSHTLLRAVKDSLTENTTNVVWARVAGVMPDVLEERCAPERSGLIIVLITCDSSLPLVFISPVWVSAVKIWGLVFHLSSFIPLCGSKRWRTRLRNSCK